MEFQVGYRALPYMANIDTSMKIQYQLISEKEMLVQKYIGNFSFEHYSAYMDQLMKKADWKCVKKVLTDLREANLKLAYENLDKLTEFRDKVVKKKYINVFLVDKPSSTVTVHLYQDSLINKEYNYKYCSTIESALSLLQLSESKKELEFMLNNMEDQF